ncbi:MAG: nucleoside phosphorylase [Candidatus Dormibacteraeota bacterium]|nr:nucleoside phosphorylase [Candidatus Dormibacteraeota bacterium]
MPDQEPSRAYHLGLAPGEVAPLVLLPGDPFRTERIAARLEGAREIAFSREFRTFTGLAGGNPVSAVSSGIGGPSVAIAVEELAPLGVRTIVRVGTCGALQPGIEVGDLVIATAAVRSEGTPDGYVPRAFPAVADREVVSALVEAARADGVAHHVGIVRSVDGLYPEIAPGLMPLRESLAEELQTWKRAGVLGSDMESATLFIVSHLRGIRAGTILLCVDDVESGAIQHLDPSLMDRLIAVAVDAAPRLTEGT